MLQNPRFPMLFLGLACSWAGLAHAAEQSTVPAGAQVIANNTPRFGATAKNIGVENPSSAIEVSIWLNLHNRGELDSMAKDAYDRNSGNYRHWLDRADFAARFAPTAAEAKTVQDFLTAHNLTVVTTGPHNLFVRARGTVGDAQKAFHVEIDKFQLNGKTFRGNTSDPYVEGAAGVLTSAVSGLNNLEYEHPIMTAKSAAKAKTPPGYSAAANIAQSDLFASNCFTGPKTETYSTMGSYPEATYKGNGYTDNPAGCGYTPSQLQTAYNLKALYKEGYDGTGQTIVIVDWCGSPTVKQDANAFSAKYGLPALTSSNFSIVNYPTPSTCSGPDVEINLDVEWSHAVAPGANILLMVPPSASFQDTDEAVSFAILNGYGNVISNSYGAEELYVDPAQLVIADLINEIGAILGVSVNFSSGDSGDYTYDSPQYNPPSVSTPADSPWATAVGGVSVALNSSNAIEWQTGWGNNETLLIDEGYIYDPPVNFGFYAGAGGGPSAFFAKPYYQDKLKGTARQLPDISWVADPFTGVVIAITEPGVEPSPIYEAIGGTSVACPMFSGLWAIANQEAGMPLGLAASYVYSMPKGTITDVLPYSSTSNVTASIKESTTLTNKYTAAELAAPLENTTKYLSVLWDYPLAQDTTLVLTFGTDSGLTVTTGWDNVTGVGTPNGKAFADYFKP